MGGRDHSCEGCGRGGFNNDLPCICGSLSPLAIEKAMEGDLQDQDIVIDVLKRALPGLEEDFVYSIVSEIDNIDEDKLDEACENGELKGLIKDTVKKHLKPKKP